MTGKFLISSQPAKPFQWVRLVAIALLVVAICVRFVGLDRKVYWHDEAYTSMVITARPGKYFTEAMFQNKLVKPADLLAYQQFVPNLNLSDMIVRKGMEDGQHPPLYYVLLRFWAQILGTSPAIIRGFSALLSLLVFPAVYWLCLELFESSLSGWVAIALFAVSPFHLVFAQEARQFGLWTALILVSSALLLRAMRIPSWRNWALYGLSMTGAFYTALFSLYIAIGHFAYVVVVDGENRWFRLPLRLGKRTIASAIALLLVAVSFTPWLYFMAASQQTLGGTTSWTAISLPILIYAQNLILNFSRSFFDFNADFNDDFNDVYVYVLAVPILMLQAYAVYVLGRTAPRRVWWFIFTFAGSTALLLGLPDLLMGGQRFTVPRYTIACYVGLQLAVVYLLSTYLTATQVWKSWFARLVFSLLILLGIISSGMYAQSNTWWNKSLNSNYSHLADLINRSDRPLIIADAFSYYPGSLISLSYQLKPDTQLLLLPAVDTSFLVKPFPAGVRTVFLFNLPPVFRQQFEARYHQKLNLAFRDNWNEVWKN